MEIETSSGEILRQLLDDLLARLLASERVHQIASIFLGRPERRRRQRVAILRLGLESRTDLSHLPIDLHFLLIPFAENAEFEQQILGRAMQCIECTPSMSG